MTRKKGGATRGPQYADRNATTPQAGRDSGRPVRAQYARPRWLPRVWWGAAVVAATACAGDRSGGAAEREDAARHNPASGRFLYVWAWDADRQSVDFLAVIDGDSRSRGYGSLVTTVPTDVVGRAHHTEHVMPSGGVFFANSFDAGTTFLFDVSDPAHPRIAGSFGARGPYTYPHSFARLPNGNVLATFQNRGEGNRRPGGLVELDPDGGMVRASDAAAPDIDRGIRPYSLVVLPELDRVVSTTTDMRAEVTARSVQVWRLSDLELLKTVVMPAGERGSEPYLPAEPRVLTDGRTVVVNTFTCGLYLLSGLEGTDPEATLIHTFPFQPPRQTCALPVVIGRYWVQTVPAAEALISLDMSDPANPKPVHELRLGDEYRPHWISADPGLPRIVVTGRGAMLHRVLIVQVDTTTGGMVLDPAFRDPGSDRPGVRFDRDRWPHGTTGAAVPHAALFSR